MVLPGQYLLTGKSRLMAVLCKSVSEFSGKLVSSDHYTSLVQGDVRFAEVMEMMGATVKWAPYSITITGPKAFGQPLRGFDHDCNDIPDAAMTAAVAALFAEVRSELCCFPQIVWYFVAQSCFRVRHAGHCMTICRVVEASTPHTTC